VTDQPWLRQPKESQRAFRAFQWYCHLGPARSLRLAYKAFLADKAAGGSGYTPATPPAEGKGRRGDPLPGQWVTWSRRFKWAARAKAFDDANTSLVEDVRARVAVDTAEAWARRREELRERDYLLGEQLQQRVKDLLESRFEEVTPAGVARMAEAGSKLARLAAGLPTDYTNVQVTPAPATPGLAELSDLALKAHLCQLIVDSLALIRSMPIAIKAARLEEMLASSQPVAEPVTPANQS
jgi:hypothetical protein